MNQSIEEISVADFLLTELLFTLMQHTNTKSTRELSELKERDPQEYRTKAKICFMEVTPECRKHVHELARAHAAKQRQDSNI